MGKLAAPFLALLAVLTTAVCADAARIRLPRPKRGLQMRMGKFTIPAAREREVCEFRTLPNRKSIDAQEFEFEMTPGSHHIALWAYLGQDRNPADFPQTIVDAPGCIGVGPRDAFERALLGDDRALSRPPGRDRLRSPRLAAARAPSPISLSGA